MKTYKLNVNGETKEFKFNPLGWSEFPKFMGLVSILGSKKQEEMISSLDEQTTEKLMDLELKMFRKSYPNIPESEVKEIIIQNVFPLMEALMETNLQAKK